MFIRYHIFYYALGYLLIVLGLYFHALFIFFFVSYVIWLYYRLSLYHVLILLLLSLTIFIPRFPSVELPDTLQGQVVKTSEKYCYFKTEIGTVKLYHEYDIKYGDKMIASISPLEMKENSNDNAFDEKMYLYSQKVFYKARLDKMIDHQSTYSLYQWIEERMSNEPMIQDYQRLFLFGEKTADIQEDYRQLSQFSLVHLFVLSGMHVHILFFIFTKVFHFFFNQKLSKWLSLLCLAFYIFSIPMQISLYRAFFMVLLYQILKHWFHELDVLSLLVIISLLYNPYIIYNISFIFSYFIYFVLLLTKSFRHSWLLIYISTIPIVLSLNYQIPIIAFLIGHILTPFIELFYCLCCFSIFFQFLESGLFLCIKLLQLIINFLAFIQSYFIFSKPSFSFLIMFYILFFMIIDYLQMRKKINKLISCMLALFIAFSIYSQYKIYGEITMIDVGQGDCTLIRLPMNQGNVLIDTGGQKDYDLANQTIIPYLKSIGIQSLDYVYISHDDFDHCGALKSLQENFDVKNVIDEYEEYRKIGCMEVEMLKSDFYYQDSNDQSLVMIVKIFDMSILFTGDISMQVENDLYQKYGKLDIDILKVSHHGSQTSSSPALFLMIEPDIAMIGVKKNNIYRHPSSQVIERLKRKNITILRTDEDGMFHIRFYNKSRYILR